MDLRHLATLSPVDYAVPGFVLLVLAEIIVARIRDRSRYEPNDTLTSLALGLGSTIAGLLTGGLFVAIALWVYQFRLVEIGYTWWAFLIVFVLDDFGYYWVHRAGHRIRWAWAAHVIHHSSQHYNLSTALRQTWTGFFGATFILKLPLFLIGFPVPMVAFVGGINLIYQFWIHTEVIGRMPRWFEAVMNTPSHHRVHHATNPRYLDMNYAGVFIVWDKMFGTFTPELDAEKPRYGIVKNLGSFNLIWAAFHEWVGIAKDVWAAPTLRAKINYMIKPPGWSHDGSRETSESIKELWEQREREKDTWNKPISSSSEADRVAPPPRGRLSEDGRYSVALLEAGGRNTGLVTRIPGFMGKQTPKTNWAYETVPQAGLNGRRGYQPRGRGLGGSSAINAMLYIRGAAWDYDNWAALGCDGWAYEDVLPVFKRSEANVHGASAYHGADGPLRVSDQVAPHPGSVEFVEAGASLQIPRNDDFNGARQEGVGLYQVTQSGGERWTAAKGYVEPARGRPNFTIVTDATVERVLFEDGKVCGVTYARGKEQRVIRATKVVLAGGVFGTPQLLMLSGIGPAAHLAEHGITPIVDRPAVGANLQDHVDYVAAFEVPGRYFLGQSFVGNLAMLGELLRWLRKREGALTSPFAEAGGFLTVTPGAPAPDVQFHFVPIPLEDHGRTAVKAHGFSCHVCVLRPESRGTVRLASGNVRDAPLIDPAFLTDDRDMTVMKAGVRAMYRILNSPPLNRHGAKDRYPIDLDNDDALDRLIRARADTVYHPVGTARMGNDGDAVCDPKLRVRGVEGLYVADASIMPRLISGNTNAPSIMIGERCADFVRADLG